ncbi:hypothetical protein DFH11DRAFT_1585908 [Phellopilus nigrolimitatus]|nr:hypothetical protein DFH11DRAFT_1585908 [Phellopilus nigrolimitatus]
MLGLLILTIGDIPGGKLCWFWAGCWCCCCCPRNSAHGRRFTRDDPPTSVLHRQTLFTLLSENHKSGCSCKSQLRSASAFVCVATCKSCQRRTRAIRVCALRPQLPFSPSILAQPARGDFCASLGRPFDCHHAASGVPANYVESLLRP